MSRIFTILFLFIFLPILAFANQQSVFLDNARPNGLTLSGKSPDGFYLSANINQLTVNLAETPWGEFTYLSLPDLEGRHLTIGQADLPVIRQLIDIPYGAEVKLTVLSYQTEEIDLGQLGFDRPIMPYQGPIVKTEEALRQHVFRMDKVYYQSDEYQQLPLTEFREVGNLRGHRLGQVTLNVVRYLPARNKIIIYKNIELKVEFSGADIATTRQIHEKYDSPFFTPVLKEFLINLESTRGDLTRYPIHYVIIYYDAFESDLQPFIQWKQQKGFIVTAEKISTIGNTTTAIKNYIQNLYNGPTPPSFVLLVGDKEQITTNNGQAGSHVTDLYYTTMTVGDFVPDIYIGRLSAQVSPHLTAQLDKILPYEQYQFSQTAFLNHGCFIATSDAGNYTIAEGTHNYVINTHFIPNNLLYDKLYAITYGSTGQDVINAVNAGRFIVNYSGHGSGTSWAGPSVSQSMVNSTTNVGMYPFVISNACDTGEFQLLECFGETWVRKANGGGLAFTGASNSTYWGEDDDWERRAYDGVFWENYHTLAAFILRGNLGVLNSGSSRAKYYFEVYHLFGDPSLMLYWGEAPQMTVNTTGIIFLGSPVYDVTVVGEDSALVSLYMNGTNYGTALTDANGYAQVQLNPVPTVPGNMILTVTKFNRQPYIDTLQVIPASGPYLYCLSPLIDDQAGNNNGIPEAGETFSMNMEVANMGVADANNVQATLSTTDTMVQVLTAQSAMGTIAAGDTVVGGNFLVHLSPEIDHLATCTFNLHLEADGGYSWDQTIYITVRKGGLIEIVNAPLNFPNTFLNFTSTQVLQLRNNGPDTLWVTNITSNLPEFTADPQNIRIAPGAQESVNILFTPTATQTYNATLTIYSTDPIHFDTTFTASGTGIYAPDISVEPDSISRALNVTDSVTIPVRVINSGLGELVYNAQIAGYPPVGGITEGSGGADNYGHIWIDSNEPGGPEFQWLDITATGTQLALTGNNSISGKVSIGFDFPFYGQPYTEFRVCTNGWLSFSTYSVAYNNVSLPSNLAPRSLIAPLWDDLNFQPDSKVFFENQTNKAIILFQDVYRVTGEGPYTFEVILYDNGNIVLQYLNLTGINHDYTVGIQNQFGDDGLTIAYNQPYLEDSLAIIISKHSWATVSPMSGIIPAQSSDTLYLTLKTHNFPMGEFWATIQIESNDPDETLYYVPIHMVVDTSAMGIELPGELTPKRFTLQQNWPNPFNPSTTIAYTLPGAAEVDLTIYDVLGQRVKTLVREKQPAGKYSVQWDGTNEFGIQVASGIYIYRITAGNKTATRKLILMR